jgi:hypothetical protein
MTLTVTAMRSAVGGNQVELSDYRVNQAGFVIHPAVHVARHEATNGS